MSKIVDDKINVWDVIDTYYRDEPYYKSQHQVDCLMNCLSKMVFKNY